VLPAKQDGYPSTERWGITSRAYPQGRGYKGWSIKLVRTEPIHSSELFTSLVTTKEGNEKRRRSAASSDTLEGGDLEKMLPPVHPRSLPDPPERVFDLDGVVVLYRDMELWYMFFP